MAPTSHFFNFGHKQNSWMPYAPLGTVKQDKTFRASFDTEPDASAPSPGGLIDDAFFRSGLVTADFFTKVKTFLQTGVTSGTLLGRSPILALDLQCLKHGAMAHKSRYDWVI